MEEQIIGQLKKSKLARYWPLLCLILIAALVASAISSTMRPFNTGWTQSFMGIFLCQFAMLKLFNPKGFADGFQKYDIIASKTRIYAYIYPLIELALGLGYLKHAVPNMLYIVTIVVLGTGAVGVIQALLKGLDVRCACMGTALDVPLSTVTLIEDIGMVIMAILLLLKI